MSEIMICYATNARRKALYAGLPRGLTVLQKAGCRIACLNGSFVSNKPKPLDYDVCWDPVGVDPTKLDPVFLDFSAGRKRQKQKFQGEFLPSSADLGGQTFVEFFQIDKHTGNRKGILRVSLKIHAESLI